MPAETPARSLSFKVSQNRLRRLLNTDFLINQAVLYALLAVLAVAVYVLLVTGLSLIFGSALPPTHPAAIGLMVFLLALFFNPLRQRLQDMVDSIFSKGQIIYRNRLQAFNRALTEALDLPAILALLRQYAGQGFSPSQLHLFIRDSWSDYYLAAPGDNGEATTDIRFPSSSVLVQTLHNQRAPIFLEDSGSGVGENLPALLQEERSRLALLGSQLYIPLLGRKTLIGWLAFGQRRSGEAYTQRDLSFLESLCGQAALAVERAQVVSDLERRVREMNVLTRISQGINFTLAFDDILELISAQANQIIPARDFRITLYDPASQNLYHAFYLENDERLAERENFPLPASQGLEAEVINSQRAVVTDDYERECRNRGLSPASRGLYAWMSVPMNAGADTIGLISLASRDPAAVYTDEQRNILQAIADQAAGAIVKARLLEETERRARQLATLNEIARSLTSTLELKPLLNRILQSATEILNCEAGSLFLVDPQTGELVFEVVIGPVAGELMGKRLPPGTGLVGEAVQLKKAIIANDAKRRKEWFDKIAIQTGFDTQDILVVPMELQERVIGVIEVINKADGGPFNLADQELLTTFTSQATIAIENARLYTLTDQALAARVEELSVMQQIDRELNASLDLDRAMKITLDWAMRQSGAPAGLMGLVEPKGVRLVVSNGFPLDDVPAQGASGGDGATFYLPAGLPALEKMLQTGQPESVALAHLISGNGSAPAGSLLPAATLQVAIPIQREAGVIGVLFLESASEDSYKPETLAFLSRLCDHAAIAIANAHLYQQVTEANLAKSKFVSFVAHELKNPMSSIKGYTELVAKGMAGPVTEMQANFLGTVRANVDRMNTIVTDLNDLTKIQVGSLRLEFKRVSVMETIEEVVRTLNRQVEEKQLCLQRRISPEMPSVWADPLRLGQVLTNLVSNAIKYTRPNGEVDVGAERWVGQAEDATGGEFVHLWVQDTGIGISPEDQANIFQQYFRTEMSKEMASGTGLGLNITKSLVEMQGGRIWFESELGKGTTFHFTIPVSE